MTAALERAHDDRLAFLGGVAHDLRSPLSAMKMGELDAPGLVAARADPGRVEQVIGNLVTNAIKYSPGGGPVRVSVARRGDHAEISVADRGTGIAEDGIPSSSRRSAGVPRVARWRRERGAA